MAKRSHNWNDLPRPDCSITDKLIDWYKKNGRLYRWRQTRDPFRIISVELMLQRTRADQVSPVFAEYSKRFSSPQDVVSGGREQVDEVFRHLGLQWRAKYFWELQNELLERWNGEVPLDYDDLTALPGVGQYAATAVRVFAFGKSETVVDSNVLRVVGRYFGIDFPDHARRSPRVRRWLAQFAPDKPEDVRRFNWALIDFGALVCTPSNPDCERCLLRDDCWYPSRISED